METGPKNRLTAKVFNCERPEHRAVQSIVFGMIAFAVSNLAMRTLFAAIVMAFSDPLFAQENFGELMTDPFGWGQYTFAAASIFGACGGAVSYVRDQNTKEWAGAGLRAFTGHMVVAQFAAVMAFLLARLAGWDGYWVIAITGFAGYLGDKALDRLEPLWDALVSVLTSKKGPPSP